MSSGIMISTFTTGIAEAREYVGAAIPRVSGLKDAPAEPRGLSKVRQLWRQTNERVDEVQAIFDALTQALVAERASSGDFTPQARSRRVGEIVAHFRAQFDQSQGAALDNLNKLIELSSREALPQRPQPEDVLQEQRIAGIKADLSMLLAPQDLRSIDNPVGDFLSSALDRGDDLAVWLVATSGWLDLYLRSRASSGIEYDAAREATAARVGQVLDSHSPTGGDTDTMRKLNRVIADPKRGAVSMRTYLSGFASNVFRDLSDWP